MIYAISGIRDLNPLDAPFVEEGLEGLRHASRPRISVVRVGGAPGVDAVALGWLVRTGQPFELHAPARFQDLPKITKDLLARSQRAAPMSPVSVSRGILEWVVAGAVCRLVEWGGDPSEPETYLKRNDAMLDGALPGVMPHTHVRAEHLTAFTDGRNTGGTRYTINAARSRVIPTTTHHVRNDKPVPPVVNAPSLFPVKP